MGEGGAYRVRCKDWVSPYLRQQWCCYTTSEWKQAIVNIAKILCSTSLGKIFKEDVIGSGVVALREDLEHAPGRLFLALVVRFAHLPFDEITNQPYDIADHGIFEIEIVKWNHWILWHYDVDFEIDKGEYIVEDSKEKVLEIVFEEGKPVEKGHKFLYVSEKEYW